MGPSSSTTPSVFVGGISPPCQVEQLGDRVGQIEYSDTYLAICAASSVITGGKVHSYHGRLQAVIVVVVDVVDKPGQRVGDAEHDERQLRHWTAPEPIPVPGTYRRTNTARTCSIPWKKRYNEI